MNAIPSGSFTLHFESWTEDHPGPQWQARFERFWPGYRAWFLRAGSVGRPSYLDCRRALRRHMPELVPIWESVVALAGGGDIEARFLSQWSPPPYIGGCSQAVWLDAAGLQAPALLRNYDYAPALLEGSWLASRWLGPRVAVMSDCLWGALDGINEAGLACSLSFGGRTVSGEGFGVPLVVRYVLEAAQSTAEAVAILTRIPVSMTYTITLLDRHANWATVYVAPDRAAVVNKRRAVTNHQLAIEWPQHANATRTLERLALLEAGLTQASSAHELAQTMLHQPLAQGAFQRGYGTLYSALYTPLTGQAELLWPDVQWPQSVTGFVVEERDIHFKL